MTATITCDWCSRPLDGDGYDDDELDRMGLEGADSPHVVLEARLDGSRGRRVVADFHHPDCYLAALDLIRDRRLWAEADPAHGRAALPKWDGDTLVEPGTPLDMLCVSWLTLKALREAGYETMEQLPRDLGKLMRVRGLGYKRAGQVLHAIELHERDRQKEKK